MKWSEESQRSFTPLRCVQDDNHRSFVPQDDTGSVVIQSEMKWSEESKINMGKQFYVYIATNKGNSVLYTGVTNNIARRMFEHKNKLAKGFTEKYNVNKLIFYEVFNNPQEAIEAEKKIKGWSRIKKLALIEKDNSGWENLLEGQ